MLSCRHHYVPYAQASEGANIVVDGTRNDNTALSLSHWPKSGTPWPLKADTSAEIVFKYLDMAEWHQDVPAVTNDHFDEDGLIGLFALIEPESDLKHRELLIDAAQAGDFGVYRDRRAARIAFTISRLVDPAVSPWNPQFIRLESFNDYPAYCVTVFTRLLEQLQGIVEDIDAHKELWADEDAMLTASEQAFENGEATLEEVTELDLAVVRLPAGWSERPAHRFTQQRDVMIHPMAVHNRTHCNRIATLGGDKLRFDYRYESWVQMASRRPPLRVDLAPLAQTLSGAEGGKIVWEAETVDQLTPGLVPQGGVSGLDHDRFVEHLSAALRNGEPAWDPYDPVP
jgi:hypothetical protein